MKRFASLVVITCLCIGRISAQTAAEMNTKLSTIMDSVTTISGDWKEKMGELKEGSKHFEELKYMRAHLEAVIDKETANLKKTKDVEESGRYRNAIIAFLTYEKQVVTTAYTPFEKLKPTATDDQIKACNDKLEDSIKKEDELKSEVISAQNEFIKENKIPVETTE